MSPKSSDVIAHPQSAKRAQPLGNENGIFALRLHLIEMAISYSEFASVGASVSNQEARMTPPIKSKIIEFAHDERANLIRRIAHFLGEPETLFIDQSGADSKFSQTIELLRTWEDLENTTDRRKVLAFARALKAVRSAPQNIP